MALCAVSILPARSDTETNCQEFGKKKKKEGQRDLVIIYVRVWHCVEAESSYSESVTCAHTHTDWGSRHSQARCFNSLYIAVAMTFCICMSLGNSFSQHFVHSPHFFCGSHRLPNSPSVVLNFLLFICACLFFTGSMTSDITGGKYTHTHTRWRLTFSWFTWLKQP